MSDPSEIDFAGARRAVQYKLECQTDVWLLTAVDLDGREYLICTYEDHVTAELAFFHLNGKQLLG